MKGAAVRRFLDRHGLSARRDLGQNFLVDEALADKLADLAGAGPDDTVLEIGTGLGIFTRALAVRARRVVSIEIDAGLVRALRADDVLPGNVELLHGDALALDLDAIVSGCEAPVRAAGNLPYAVASPLLRRLLDLRERLVGWSVMVQREVADRLLAAPGGRDYGSLAVLHRLTVDMERALDLRPGCFYPAPAVVSSFVRLTPRATPGLRPGELETLERLVRGAFAHRRKTLVNSLRTAGGLDAATLARVEGWLAERGHDPRTRAERLPPEDWLHLERSLADTDGEEPRP